MLRRMTGGLIAGYLAALLALASATAEAQTLGRVVAIGGQASDLALDEGRRNLYIANFTANRIDVLNLDTNTVRTSISVPAQPSSLSVSPDGRYLLISHYANFAAPGTPSNGLTLIDLTNNSRAFYALSAAPFGVAFGFDGKALVVTSADFQLFDPASGSLQLIGTIPDVPAKTLPQPPATFPPSIITASVAVSGDGRVAYGLTDTFYFRADFRTRQIYVIGYTSSPAQGPRVVSVNQDGTRWTGGWTLSDSEGYSISEFNQPSGLLNVGSHAIDSRRGLVYAQIPESGGGSGSAPPRNPVLVVHTADNLQVLERYRLRENLAGKSVLNRDSSVLYSISDSGVTVIPVGSLGQTPRVVASTPDLAFRGSFCERRVLSQQITISSPGTSGVPFSLTASAPGVSVRPASGVTPAVVTVSVDPSAFSNQKGTASVNLTLSSSAAVNLPDPIRILINNREPDQRGSFINVPGRLVDVLADPVRDRFYLLRQNTNEVLVYDANTMTQVTSLRTGNMPTQMAITFDSRYIIIGGDRTQMLWIYDLETFRPEPLIRMPGGHYPRSIAVSSRAILVANRVAGPTHVIDSVDLTSRTVTTLASLGVFENKIDPDTVLVASPNGASILGASKDGLVFLYNANVDTFTVQRKDQGSLGGAYAASNFDNFIVGNQLLNSSLVATNPQMLSGGRSSGAAFVDGAAYVSAAESDSSPGVIARIDTEGSPVRPTRVVEAPRLGNDSFAFTRTLAPLSSRRSIINLTTSGFTILPWNYDASTAPPRIDRVVNAADFGAAIAPGGLISIFGTQLSPVNMASNEIPIPTALGESCLTVNGLPVPILFVSGNQVNAQLPFQSAGNVQLILRTPGGVSDTFNLTVLPVAPSVFRSSDDLPVIVRTRNDFLVTPTNPIHKRDVLIIYLPGLGAVNPPVAPGSPAPGNPPSTVLTPATVSLGGVPLEVQFAGLSPGSVGLYQINVVVPDYVPLGLQVPLTIAQGTFSTTFGVRVVN